MKITRILASLLFASQLLAQSTPAIVENRNAFVQEHENYTRLVSYIPATISGVALFGLVASHYAYRKSDRYNQFCGEIAEQLVAGKDRREREAKDHEEKEKKARKEKREQDIKDAAEQRIRDREEADAREKKQKADDAAAEMKRLENERQELEQNVMRFEKPDAHGECHLCHDEEARDLFSVHDDKSHLYCGGCLRNMNRCPEELGCARKFQRPANLERMWKDGANFAGKIKEAYTDRISNLRKNLPQQQNLPRVNTPRG